MYFFLTFLTLQTWPTHLTYNIFLSISLSVPRAGQSEIAQLIHGMIDLSLFRDKQKLICASQLVESSPPYNSEAPCLFEICNNKCSTLKLKAEMWSFRRIGPKKLKETDSIPILFLKCKAALAAAPAAAIADEWNVKDRPYQALS